MKNSAFIILICLILSACSAASGERELAPGDTMTIAVMSTTDLHGHVRAWDYYRDRPEPRYAMSKVATLVDSVRGVHKHNLLLDAGDWLQGNSFAEYFARVDTTAPYPLLTAADHMEYDAIVLGNHEFNYGIEHLNMRIEQTRTPIIGANIYHHGTNDPAYPPYIMKNFRGVNVAVLGLTTPGSAVWDRPRVEGRLDFGDGTEAAERFAGKLRDEGADIIIVLAHSALNGRSSYQVEGLGEENFGRSVGETVPGVNLLVLGHSHRVIEDVYLEGAGGETVGVSQAGRWGSHLGVAELTVIRDDEGEIRIIGQHSRAHPVSGVEEHPEIVELVEDDHEHVRSYINTPIASTPDEWRAGSSRREDTPVIDLIQHIQKKATGAQLSAAAAFNTGANFGPGDITVGQLALLYPYENTLYTMRITGRQIREFLEYTSQYYLQSNNGEPETRRGWPGFNFDMLSGVDYTMDIRREAGERITRLEYEGAPVRDDQEFTIAINSYRAEGGGGFDMLAGAEVLDRSEQSVRDIMIDYLREKGEIRHDDVFEENWELVY